MRARDPLVRAGCVVPLPAVAAAATAAVRVTRRVAADGNALDAALACVTACGVRVADLDPVVGPTVGFSAPVRRSLDGAELVFYDLGGGSRIRGVWPNYFPDVRRR